MGRDEPTGPVPGEGNPERGWFDPAFNGELPVHDCLAAVIRTEATRLAFVRTLQEKLAPDPAAKADRVTDLMGRLAVFGNTLKFRLGLLSPERTGAWFRDSMRCTGGPFPQQILADPVFNNFKPADAPLIAAKLRSSFATRRVEEIPFAKQESCLWLTLLQLNREWNDLCGIKIEEKDLRLDVLPDGLPAALESQALRTFLINVRNALGAARSRLDESYYALWHASEQFFKHIQQNEPPQPAGRAETGRGREGGSSESRSQQGADELRESMRSRRASMLRGRALSIKERRALQFMEFDAYPDAVQLKKRYLTLARRYHPDTPGGNEEEFKKLAMYYNYLVECLRHIPTSEQ